MFPAPPRPETKGPREEEDEAVEATEVRLRDEGEVVEVVVLPAPPRPNWTRVVVVGKGSVRL